MISFLLRIFFVLISTYLTAVHLLACTSHFLYVNNDCFIANCIIQWSLYTLDHFIIILE